LVAGQETGHITTRDERYITTRRGTDAAQTVLQIVSLAEGADGTAAEMITLRVGAGVYVARQSMGADAATPGRNHISGPDQNVLAGCQIDVAAARLD
jgi:hypothetical protein